MVLLWDLQITIFHIDFYYKTGCMHFNRSWRWRYFQQASSYVYNKLNLTPRMNFHNRFSYEKCKIFQIHLVTMIYARERFNNTLYNQHNLNVFLCRILSTFISFRCKLVCFEKKNFDMTWCNTYTFLHTNFYFMMILTSYRFLYH